MAEPGRGLTGRIGYALGSAKVLVDAGVIRPIRPDKLVKVLTTLARFGRSPAAGHDLAGRPLPGRDDDRRRARHAHVRRGPPRTNALAHALSDAGDQGGRRRGDHVPQPPRLHRVDRGRVEARRGRALPQHRLRRSAAHRGGQAREAGRRSSTTRSSPGCSRRPASGASASWPGTTPSAPPTPPSTT